jgi:putative transposase
MPRKLRVEYPGAMYHVMSRGDRCQEIFLDDVVRQDFLKAPAEACQKAGWRVHAYCLMRNHFHMVVETSNAAGSSSSPSASLSLNPPTRPTVANWGT